MERNDSANLPSPGGSETVDPSTDINNPENWDFADSDDDDQNNPAPLQDGIESETDEAAETADQETDEPVEEQAEDAPAEGEQPVDEAKLDESLVTLKGGEQVPFTELKLGYMRERDYRIKTQDISNKGRTLHEMSERVKASILLITERMVTQKELEWRTARGVEDRQRNEASVKEIRESLVPRAEHERVWQNYTNKDEDLQRQVDELKQSQGSVYGARDVILDLRQRLDRVERERIGQP